MAITTPRKPDSVTYHPNQANAWMTGGMFLAMSLPLAYVAFELLSVPFRFPAGPDLAMMTGLGLAAMSLAGICGLAGALLCIGTWRGTAGVTLTRTGIRQTSSLFGEKWAEWSSLTPFAEGTYPRPRGPDVKCARALIVGPRVSKNLRRWKEFVILDGFPTPIATMVGEMNAWRASGGYDTVPPDETAPRLAVGTGTRMTSRVRLAVGVIGGLGILVKIYVTWIAPRH